MRWQLQTVVDEDPYLDYSFPLNQFWGANVSLVNALVVVHPLITDRVVNLVGNAVKVHRQGTGDSVGFGASR